MDHVVVMLLEQVQRNKIMDELLEELVHRIIALEKALLGDDL
tara:strand:- start:290 stop:415 length:126 start_codon:yes stop_codon:yes gene_type:complete